MHGTTGCQARDPSKERDGVGKGERVLRGFRTRIWDGAGEKSRARLRIAIDDLSETKGDCKLVVAYLRSTSIYKANLPPGVLPALNLSLALQVKLHHRDRTAHRCSPWSLSRPSSLLPRRPPWLSPRLASFRACTSARRSPAARRERTTATTSPSGPTAARTCATPTRPAASTA